MNLFRKTLAAALCIGLTTLPFPSLAYSYKSIVKAAERAEAEVSNAHSFDVPAKGRLEVAFSPNEGSERLVIKVIDSATRELLVLSYSFTSAPVTEAMIRAVHRGVAVRLVADYKNNVSGDRSGKARAALSALKNAGADVRVIRVYPIHHDKVLVANRQTVEMGSYNFSAAAAGKNSENVLVNWDNPDLAAVYVKHFERNYKQSEAYTTQY